MRLLCSARGNVPAAWGGTTPASSTWRWNRAACRRLTYLGRLFRFRGHLRCQPTPWWWTVVEWSGASDVGLGLMLQRAGNAQTGRCPRASPCNIGGRALLLGLWCLHFPEGASAGSDVQGTACGRGGCVAASPHAPTAAPSHRELLRPAPPPRHRRRHGVHRPWGVSFCFTESLNAGVRSGRSRREAR